MYGFSHHLFDISREKDTGGVIPHLGQIKDRVAVLHKYREGCNMFIPDASSSNVCLCVILKLDAVSLREAHLPEYPL